MTKSKVFETATNLYTAIRSLGEGGSGTVYLVKDDNGTEFAVKCLRSTDRAKRKRFSNELDFCQRPVHENVIRVLGSGIAEAKGERLPFYVMPHYGATLRTLIVHGIAPDQVLPLFDQILSGVEAAHLHGVCHRDLKPENILYNASLNRLVIADFGIAHFEEDVLLTAVETQDRERLANFVYAAPEQRERGKTVDLRADIFALGLIFNELFTGTVALGVDHPTIAQAAPKYGYLDEIVSRMLKHSAADRYQTVNRIKEELIARGMKSVLLQRRDGLRETIVPATSPDDPLDGKDITIVAFQYSPESDELLFWFNADPPAAWKVTLQNLRVPNWMGDAEPKRIRFYHRHAGIPATERTMVLIGKNLKQWVGEANEEYRRKLAQEAAAKHEALVLSLAKQRALADAKLRAGDALAELL
ncbi:MAG: serine/threonine protein kinase [Bryobacterales bacterium]|nr:serine/threonine protein kinase [Acidobacteriota bacterium]MBV9399839.1 serine/threonine protein kinase [Bryobacterales bacterium]